MAGFRATFTRLGAPSCTPRVPRALTLIRTLRASPFPPQSFVMVLELFWEWELRTCSTYHNWRLLLLAAVTMTPAPRFVRFLADMAWENARTEQKETKRKGKKTHEMNKSKNAHLLVLS